MVGDKESDAEIAASSTIGNEIAKKVSKMKGRGQVSQPVTE